MANPVLCAFLISCFTEKLNLNECPKNCECYSASNTLNGVPNSDMLALSLVCDNNPFSKQYGEFPDQKQIQTIAESYVINTLAFKNIHTTDIMPKHYLDSFFISKLVFENSKLSEKLEPIDPENHNKHHLENIELKALTFRNCDFISQGGVKFNWTVFHKLIDLQAIHIEGGRMPALDPLWVSIPGENILTATFIQSELCYIRTGFFERWLKLRRLTITDNTISNLEWISTVMPNLWYLDVSRNKIYGILFDLTINLPLLKVLKLDQNDIKVINYPVVIKPLLLSNVLREFSFTGMTFCTDSSMIWTQEVLDDTSIAKFPMFFENSLILTLCQEYETNDLPVDYQPKQCYTLERSSFNDSLCKLSNASHCIHQ